MKKRSLITRVLVFFAIASVSIFFFTSVISSPGNQNDDFEQEELIEVRGFSGNVMEVAVSADSQYLLFNNRFENNKDLHWASRVTDTVYQYQGVVEGTQSEAVDGTPSFDEEGNVYYITLVDYFTNGYKSIYKAKFDQGTVVDPQLVENLYVGEI